MMSAAFQKQFAYTIKYKMLILKELLMSHKINVIFKFDCIIVSFNVYSLIIAAD